MESGRPGHPCHVHSGLKLGPDITLCTREQADGTWLAWVEESGQAILEESGKPRLFLGFSCYRAQCEASRWLRETGMIVIPQCCSVALP